MNNEWISIKDRLPKAGRKIQFVTNDIKWPDNWWTGVYHGDGIWSKSNSYLYTNNVTHWMPKPKKP